MLATNYSDLRGNLKSYLDRVSDNYETLIVTRKGDRNVVMMSEESYENILENMHVLGNKENYDWLRESKSQLESGLTEMHDLAGYWSRRINDKDRLIYQVTDSNVIILACRTHYGDR